MVSLKAFKVSQLLCMIQVPNEVDTEQPSSGSYDVQYSGHITQRATLAQTLVLSCSQSPLCSTECTGAPPRPTSQTLTFDLKLY